MFLLIFATAVSVIAADFGFASWEQLMPYGAAAFLLFGLGSIPSGRLGDLWGRRPMMLVFFFGMGVAALLAAATQNAWQLADRAHAARRLRVHLPPSRHPDAVAGDAIARAGRSASTGSPATWA